MGRTGTSFHGDERYMLEDFDRSNPGVLDMGNVRDLHPPRLRIIVRKGNPPGIRSLEDLRREGISVITAELENVSDFLGGPTGSLHPMAYTGAHARKAWQSVPTIDA